MRIYFARHGESLANTQHIISNRNLPHPLTAKGCEQAAALADLLEDKGITRIFSSPIQRASETAGIISGRLNAPVEIAVALREYDCGALEGRGDDEAWRLHEEFIVSWLDNHRRDACPTGGETFYDIRDRFVPYIDKLVKDYGRGDENLLLVTHGGIILLGLPHVLVKVDFPKVRRLPLDNTILITAECRLGQLTCLTWGNEVLN